MSWALGPSRRLPAFLHRMESARKTAPLLSRLSYHVFSHAMEPASSPGQPYKYKPRVTDEEVFPKWTPRLRLGGIAAGIVMLPIAGYYLLRQPREEGNVAEARLLTVSQL